ncbi:MAG: rhomboid family intramembrane serine protease [Erysipelotrichaceae bacterium]|nr:rhomboid family intramembrane serine protease [Erysipelotrichaceae bacterium]
MKKRKIYLNAPITLGFSLICIIALLLNMVSSGKTNVLFFSTYGSSLLSPMTYIRLLGHIFGHANVDHLVSNLLYILLLGPMLEEKYGKRLIIVILSTAAVTGIVHNLLSPNTMLMGASGVVFAFIILASITGNEEGIPVTLIIVALLWIGSEIYTGITTADSVSQLTHIVGGLTGGIIGLAFKK